ncbi:transposon ty3-g Gag-Pol polyprotein [Plakobranchus ocellatus]|uniref:Transposon ty3-g Gag-Pol polyprotein n=1 Tax=Plakobranchus ocellatus TaxID=259542 RepID=A0AAV4ADB7_9GAST|nr:transposon ty3-g Gag-Pol polyprotein [Plakobranchus ocellatus]
MPLDPKSRPLTTFLTPCGRFYINRLRFSISFAPDILQRRISEILNGVERGICLVDDILIHSTHQATHDKLVKIVLQRHQEAGLTLNDKCEFYKTTILEHIDGQGICADPAKGPGYLEVFCS